MSNVGRTKLFDRYQIEVGQGIRYQRNNFKKSSFFELRGLILGVK